MEPLSRGFYQRETHLVARALLGAHVVRRIPARLLEDVAPPLDQRELVGRIVETEAYFGPSDGASHARSGRTPRSEVMYGRPGHAYVYFAYGMHWMLNVVAWNSAPGSDDASNHPAGAVLLRAIEPIEGIEWMRQWRDGRPDRELTNGPAKLCQALAVTGTSNRTDLCDPSGELIIVAGAIVPEDQVAVGPRVGIGYAPEPWQSSPLRFWIRDSEYVSR